VIFGVGGIYSVVIGLAGLVRRVRPQGAAMTCTYRGRREVPEHL
jgi:hypothetical protein